MLAALFRMVLSFLVICMMRLPMWYNQMFMLYWYSFYLNAVMSIFGKLCSQFCLQCPKILLECVRILLIRIFSDFRRFSNWIYHGIIEDPGQELFIEFMNYYLPKTKSFFDKAFIIKQSSVPGFLQGWQHSILLCGKYSNLLKLYNPMVRIFSHFSLIDDHFSSSNFNHGFHLILSSILCSP